MSQINWSLMDEIDEIIKTPNPNTDFQIGAILSAERVKQKLQEVIMEIKKRNEASYEEFKKCKSTGFGVGAHIEDGKHRAFAQILELLEGVSQ